MFPEAMLQQAQMGQSMGNESFPMPGRYVGTIIGKQGAMITQLQNQSGARIQIQQGSHGQDGTCELIGAPENIRMAKQLIEAKMAETDQRDAMPGGGPPQMGAGMQQQGGGMQGGYGYGGAQTGGAQTGGAGFDSRGGGANGPSLPASYGMGGSMGQSISVPVPASCYGSCIGKQGATIKAMQDATGASIQMEQAMKGADGTATISGTQQSINAAYAAITQRMQQQMQRDQFGGNMGGLGGNASMGGAPAGIPQHQQQQWQSALFQQQQLAAAAPAVDAATAAWNAMTPEAQAAAYAKFNEASPAAAAGAEPAAKKARTAGIPIEVGDKLPAGEMKMKNTEGVIETVDPATLFAGKKAVLFGVPGAYSPDGADHLPGYVGSADEIKAAGFELVACMAVNDAHVMASWGEKNGAAGKVTMLSDDCLSAPYTEALGMVKDAASLTFSGLSGKRCSRFAIVLNDGVVESVCVDQSTAITTSAESVMKAAAEAAAKPTEEAAEPAAAAEEEENKE